MRSRPASVSSITCWSCSQSTAGFDLKIVATGDLDVDQHHTVEDVGIVLGQLFAKALGDRRGINRAGYFVLPMDETLAVVARRSGRTPCAGLQGSGEDAAGRRSANRAGRGFLRRLRQSRGRESARQGALRPVESPQDRGDLQVFRACDALRVLEGRAPEGTVALDERVYCDFGIRLRRRQSALRPEHPGRDRGRVRIHSRRRGHPARARS